MARCRQCGETMHKGQETCYACGTHASTRAYRHEHEHRANPIVIVGVCVAVVGVLAALWLTRSNAARKQAVLQAEETAARVHDSLWRAEHQWQGAIRAAEKDEEVQALAIELDDIEARFESVVLRVAASPSPQQESIIGLAEAEFAALRRTAVVLGSSPESDRQVVRDSIQAGRQRVESLMSELGSTE